MRAREGDVSGGKASLTGRRVLVVGASAGIGRAGALAAAAAGARVVAAARRVDRLEGLARVAEGDLEVVAADLRRPSDCERIVEDARGVLGGLDAVVLAAAVTALGPLVELDQQRWHEILDTNLVGPSLVLAAALGELADSGGRALVLSSDSVAYPFPGLGAYAASKAALDKLVEAWRGEHSEVRFARVVIGPTTTEAAAGWDPELSARYFQRWADEGYLRAAVTPQSPEEVARRLVELLAADEVPDDVELLPPGMASVLGR